MSHLWVWFFGLFFETGSHWVALAALELSVDQAVPELRDLVCLCLSSARIKGEHLLCV